MQRHYNHNRAIKLGRDYSTLSDPTYTLPRGAQKVHMQVQRRRTRVQAASIGPKVISAGAQEGEAARRSSRA
jgi:hypothetical protein